MSDTYPLMKRLLSHKDDPGESIPHTCRSNLLAELVRREKLNHLVLNLYTDDLGYTIAVRINSQKPNLHQQHSKPNGGLHNNNIDNNNGQDCSRLYHQDLHYTANNNNTQNDTFDNGNNIVFETAKLSYDETSLLEFIDNEELPPLLIQLIDRSQSLCQYRIWHSGCLIIEIRDFRNGASDIIIDESNQTNGICHISEAGSTNSGTSDSDPRQNNFSNCGVQNHNSQQKTTNNFSDVVNTMNTSYNDTTSPVITNNTKEKVQQSSHTSDFILLKPTNLSMFNDMINLIESQDCDTVWTFQDRLHLESQIVLCNAPTLSLEPTESISSCASTHLHYQKDTDGKSRQSKIFKKRPFTNRKPIISSAISSGRLNLPNQLKLQQFIEARNNRDKATDIEKFVSKLSSGNRYIARLLRNRTISKK